MKIEISVDKSAQELTVQIRCPHLTPQIERILATLRLIDHQITCRRKGEIFLLDAAKVIYVESVDRRCFLYTADSVYESDLRLYELEQQLEECGFLRISKSALIHLRHIQSLQADLNRRIRITMSNGEQIIASRQYAEQLKARLGVH